MARLVLVCGGRDYADYWTVFEVLDGLHRAIPIGCIIEGGALGADRFARRWAQERGVELKTVEADWKRHGKAAGPIRNHDMLLLQPDLVVAFPGGRGTANMVTQARAAGVDVMELDDACGP
jgi:hypothetical protein